MRQPGGYLVIDDPDPPRGQPRRQEFDTVTCAHCNRMATVKPGTQVDDFVTRCRGCMRHICPICVGLGGCDPFEKKLLRAEAVP